MEERFQRLEAANRALHHSLDELGPALRQAHGAIKDLQHELSVIRDQRIPTLERRADAAEEAIRATQAEVAALRDSRIPALEGRADGLEETLKTTGEELEQLRDGRIPILEERADGLEETLKTTGEELEQLRDGRIHILEERADGLEKALKLTGEELEELRDGRIPALEGRADGLEKTLKTTGEELEQLRGGRVSLLESRADQLEELLGLAGRELERLRDGRIPETEGRMDRAEAHLAEAVQELNRLRDEGLPAAVERQDLLVQRLASGQEELGSLVERLLLAEPLPAPRSSAVEDHLSRAMQVVQPALLREFRGSEEEIAHRLERYLTVLKGNAPVLDLGCGRGELLLLLREAGVEASGVEGDPALATAARRRGVAVRQADVLSALAEEKDSSRGAVTAVHLLEHLDPVTLLHVLAEVRRILRPNGVLVAECPNPHSLRVGAALFWLDPTHVRPLLPETLALFLKASGFVVEETEYLHPFPRSQSLRAPEEEGEDAGAIGARLARLEERLEAILNGFRDFTMVARKAPAPSAGAEEVQ